MLLKSGLVVLLLFASGCGSAQNASSSRAEHAATLQVDPAFTSYVSRFEQAASAYGRPTQVTDLVIQWGQWGPVNSAGENHARGVCEVASGQTPVVTINPEAWAPSSDSEREELIFHELGHCVLGLTHIAGINSDGIPRSLMNPTEIDGAIYKQNRDFYLKGIFAKK